MSLSGIQPFAQTKSGFPIRIASGMTRKGVVNGGWFGLNYRPSAVNNLEQRNGGKKDKRR